MKKNMFPCYKLGMKLYRRENGVFYVEVTNTAGGRKRISLRTKDPRQAQMRFNQLAEKQVRAKLAYLKKKESCSIQVLRKDVLEYIEKTRTHSTYRAYKLAFNDFIATIGNINIADVNSRVIDTYIERKSSKVKPVTINTYLRHLKAGFSLAVKWDYIQKNPFQKIKFLPTGQRTRFLTFEEAERIIRSIDDREFRIIVLLYLHTGMRRSELLNLTWKDIRGEHIHVRKTKSHLERYITITDSIRSLLEELKSVTGREIGRLFKWKDPGTVSKAFRTYANKCGLEDVRLHDLRRTFGSWLVQSGVNLRVVQELMGHQQISTTAHIYSPILDETKKEALEQINLRLIHKV